MGMIRKILKAKVMDDFTLECEMENGEVYKYNMSPVLKKDGPMILPLRDIDFFKKVFIEFGCLTWSNEFNTDGGSVVLGGELLSKQTV